MNENTLNVKSLAFINKVSVVLLRTRVNLLQNNIFTDFSYSDAYKPNWQPTIYDLFRNI